jgi:hypothetical protein
MDRNASGFVTTYIYGAQIELGSIASPYTPTTTTAITNTTNPNAVNILPAKNTAA